MQGKYVTRVVRNFPFHQEEVHKLPNGKTARSRKTYMPGQEIKISESDSEKYQHLLETPEQYKSRQPKTADKKDAK